MCYPAHVSTDSERSYYNVAKDYTKAGQLHPINILNHEVKY
jgi:hypothetical protein